MALLAVLEPNPVHRTRISAALRREHALLFAREWREFLALLEARAVEGCIVNPHEPLTPRTQGLVALARFRASRPSLPLVVFSNFRGREREVYYVGRLGADAVVAAEGAETERALRDAVEEALGASLASRVTAALRGRVPEEALPVVAWAVARARRRPRADELAEAFNLDRETLNRRLREGGLPATGSLLVWGKLLQGARWLEAEGETPEGVALRLGYTTASAFRRILKKYTGATPSRVVREGGFEFVLRAFLRERTPSAPQGGARAPPAAGPSLPSTASPRAARAAR